MSKRFFYVRLNFVEDITELGVAPFLPTLFGAGLLKCPL